MLQFFDSLVDVKNNYKKYDAWEQAQNDDAAKRKYLAKVIDNPKDKVALTLEKAKTVFRATDMLDKRSEDNSADMEQSNAYLLQALAIPIGLLFGFPPIIYEQIKKKPMPFTKQIAFNIATVIPLVALTSIYKIWSSSREKEASRIGRFQAKQNELKDLKNFVIYTPQQIEAAKIIAKKLPDKNNKKDYKAVLANLKQISKDKTAYHNWLKEKDFTDAEMKKILNTNFSPEQMKQGEEDKEIIVNIVKDVNMEAENYSENVENIFDTIDLLSFVTDIPITFATKKLLNKFKISPIKNKIITGLVCAAYPLAILTWSTKKKKEGSRVGRFVKRHEILDNPEVIMSYNKEQMEMAKKIKAALAKKGIFTSTKENFSFFMKFLQNEKAYQTYIKTTNKDNEKLYDALKQVQISDKQLQDAKNLQKQTFMTFDKVDEKSQRYSEDTEAATEITKNIVNNTASVIWMAAPLVLYFGAKKGLIPVNKILNSISKYAFKPESSLIKLIKSISTEFKTNKDFKQTISNLDSKQNLKDIYKITENTKLIQSFSEFRNANKNYIDNLNKALNEKNIDKLDTAIKAILNKEITNKKFAKLTSNFLSDLLKLYLTIKTKIKPYQGLNTLDGVKKFYMDFKTLLNVSLISIFTPLMAISLGAYAISSFMTNLQLKAGRIGIMKGIDEVDNAKLFVNTPANK